MSISIDELNALPPGTTIINAGTHAGRREIRGAIRYLPHDLLEPEHLALPINHDATVVLYDAGGETHQLDQIAEKMRGDGFADVRVLGASLAAYEKAGGETQEPSLDQVVPPQLSGSEGLDRRW